MGMTQERMAYNLGYDAAILGHLPITANPYDLDRQESQWEAWRRGWRHAHLVY